MKITEIVVSRSVKLNVGNYEGTDYFLSVKAEDENGIEPGATEKLERAVETSILETLARVYKQKGVSPGGINSSKGTTRYAIAKHHGLARAERRNETTPLKDSG